MGNVICFDHNDVKVYPLLKKRIYAYQYPDASVKFSNDPVYDDGIICYRSLPVNLYHERIIILRWLLHKRHHLETVLASHDTIRDMMDRIDILSDEQLKSIAERVKNFEIGQQHLENEPK